MAFLIYYTILFILGCIFGSFSTVLIERWHNREGGILLGRSHCPKCGHILGAGELIPVLSYLIQNGKCKNCKTTIPRFYIGAELLMGIIFVIVGKFILSTEFSPIGTELLALLFFSFVTGVYILYDLRYMEIPDQIMIPGIIIILFILFGSLYSYFFYQFLFDKETYESISGLVQDHFYAAILLYSFFYIQILIPGGIHCIKTRKFSSLIELLMSYFIFPITLIFGKLFIKDNTEDDSETIPSWIGGGDLRVAIFIGLTLGSFHGIVSFFIAYILGSVIGVIILLKKGIGRSEIPFGPFLGIGWILAVGFHGEIIYYINTFINI